MLPDWLTDEDLAYYAKKFTKTGFFGGISYYRNFDANWRLMKDIPYRVMSMPILFMTGSLDFVHTSPWHGIAGSTPGIDAMRQVLTDFREPVFINGAGHWNQQEHAIQTNEALLPFLSESDPIR